MKYIPWTRSDTSGRAASRCLSRLEVFWPLRTFEDAVDLNLWLSVSFFDLFSSVASLHLETVLETLVPLPSVQASVAALLGVEKCFLVLVTTVCLVSNEASSMLSAYDKSTANSIMRQ